MNKLNTNYKLSKKHRNPQFKPVFISSNWGLWMLKAKMFSYSSFKMVTFIDLEEGV